MVVGFSLNGCFSPAQAQFSPEDWVFFCRLGRLSWERLTRRASCGRRDRNKEAPLTRGLSFMRD